MSAPGTVGRPSIESQISALAKRLLAGPIKLDETTDVEDRVLARMEQLDLVDMGATTARLTEKGKALAQGGGKVAASPHRAPNRTIQADPSEIEWGDPPDKSRGGRVSWFAPFEALLIAKPGKWARVLVTETPKESALISSSLRSTWKKAEKKFEACARRLPDGSGAVFARFVGKK